jgi:hypothetical protein
MQQGLEFAAAAVPTLAGAFALVGTWLQVQSEKAERAYIYEIATARDRLALEELRRTVWWRRRRRAKRAAHKAALGALVDGEEQALRAHDRRLDGWVALLFGSFFATAAGLGHFVSRVSEIL